MKKLLISIFVVMNINIAYAENNFFDIFKKNTETINSVEDEQKGSSIDDEMQLRWEKIKDLDQKLEFDEDKENLKANHDMYTEEFSIYMDYLKKNSEKLFEVGDYYFKNERYEKAYEIFSQDKSNLKNVFGAATVARFLNDRENALKLYDLVIQKNPNFYEAYLGRGIIKRDMGEYDEAIKDFYTYMKYSKNETIYLGLGDIYMKTGRYLDAKNILEEGRVKFPNSTLIKEMLIKAYTKLK